LFFKGVFKRDKADGNENKNVRMLFPIKKDKKQLLSVDESFFSSLIFICGFKRYVMKTKTIYLHAIL